MAPRDDLKQGLVWGFGSVVEKDGQPVVDCQGDIMSEAELQRAAHDFMRNSRVGGAMHVRHPDTGEPLKAGEIVESCVLTRELQKAMGIDLGCVPWLVCLKVTDPTVRKMIARGQLRGFSIGGAGRRTPLN